MEEKSFGMVFLVRQWTYLRTQLGRSQRSNFAVIFLPIFTFDAISDTFDALTGVMTKILAIVDIDFPRYDRKGNEWSSCLEEYSNRPDKKNTRCLLESVGRRNISMQCYAIKWTYIECKIGN
eukprot:scaffold3238_cov91-Cylindrotheca_fusiformis.AAC.5